jgi:hypothetical protein
LGTDEQHLNELNSGIDGGRICFAEEASENRGKEDGKSALKILKKVH